MINNLFCCCSEAPLAYFTKYFRGNEGKLPRLKSVLFNCASHMKVQFCKQKIADVVSEANTSISSPAATRSQVI